MRFTFNMYDFDGDGYITPEDVRIMMSYMHFNRNIQLQNVQTMLDQRGDAISMSSNGMASPSSTALNRVRAKKKEGLYQDEEGKNIAYKDRMQD